MSPRTTQINLDNLPLGMPPRTVFVTGKGGVGKSTVSAALAVAWRNAAARVLLVEIEGQSSCAALLSDREVGYEPVPVGEHIAAIRITMDEALREYARMRLKVKAVSDRLVANPIFEQFGQAAPGFRELLVLGKLWSLSTQVDKRGRPTWDAIVVDSPATGHGLGLLNMAGVVARMFPVGPIASEARQVDAFVRDHDASGVVLVALPEELPVSETIELRAQLAEQGVNVVATVLNAVLVDRFSPREAALVERASAAAGLAPHVAVALDVASQEHERCTDQAGERARLDAALDAPASLLPWMFAPRLGRDQVEALARWLSPAGQARLREQLAGAEDGPAVAAAVHATSSSGGAS